MCNKFPITHRGADPEAIAAGEKLGLSFDGMMARQYQFTVQRGPAGSQGITFYVKRLSNVRQRLLEKFTEFGIEDDDRG